ncbi:MAG: GNAT family N-acetyltransferase [Gomphosphaeria aponina SAG 52.96 = DSM 107014]|uniref:GNAT family N-acetyltransferase n=1 Tax=Gomphosphaeria aponina SAG 52.96 = DSM 107014 TaxID=1521640 RepID=A0A941GSJ0_9CHRO|nr:GNAT family N-acetyltransferase [Gomphosphaeria aponina SAG 52.96 = DSM 107014]
MIIPKLETPRLILRGWTEKDLDAYADMCSDPDVMRYINQEGKVFSRAESWRNMAMVMGHWLLRGYGLWAVEKRSHGAMIGRVGLWQPEGWPDLEVGWTLHKDFWGQGFATEAAQASLNYAFTVMGETELISLINPHNLASQRVAERLGMKQVRIEKVMGHEVIIYQIYRADWLLCHYIN